MGFQLTTLGAYFQPLHLQIVTGSSLIHVIYLTKQHHEHVHPATCPDLHETGRSMHAHGRGRGCRLEENVESLAWQDVIPGVHPIFQQINEDERALTANITMEKETK
jgi:hypothetical protein